VVAVAAPFQELGLTATNTATTYTSYTCPNVANLLGDDYAIMCLGGMGQMLGTERAGDAFAKIIWATPSRTTSFNAFAGGLTEFAVPLGRIDSLTVSFLRPNCAPYAFNGVEHSFTLKVVADA
jgi:hypothetical protein